MSQIGKDQGGTTEQIRETRRKEVQPRRKPHDIIKMTRHEAHSHCHVSTTTNTHCAGSHMVDRHTFLSHTWAEWTNWNGWKQVIGQREWEDQMGSFFNSIMIFLMNPSLSLQSVPFTHNNQLHKAFHLKLFKSFICARTISHFTWNHFIYSYKPHTVR